MFQFPENAADRAADLKDAAVDASRRTVDAIDASRDAVASRIESAGNVVHDQATRLSGASQEWGRVTAQTMDRTAQYIRQRSVRQMLSDVETLVKNNPIPSVVGAIVMGFIVGRAVNRE
jgi:ElaB/YqjD/DUF883 family membrane-anchored ribosome-binding protein